MGTETTWAGISKAGISEKIFLAEIEPAQLVVGWALSGGQTNTYDNVFLNETVTLADGSTTIIRKKISKYEEDGTGLTARATVALVEANAGSYFQDLVGGAVIAGNMAPTACCTDPDNDQDNTTGWGDVDSTITSEVGGVTGNRLKVAAIDADGRAYVILDGYAGRRYGITCQAGADVGDEYRVVVSHTEDGLLYDSGAVAGGGAGTWDAIDETFLSESDGDIHIRLYAVNNTDNAYFDDVKFYQITVPGSLFVHPADSDDANDHTNLAFFWVYLATQGVELNGKYYEPYISESGIPGITQSVESVFYGISVISSGDLEVLNHSGFFDQILESWIWINKKVKLFAGGDDLAYGEYLQIYTGLITAKEYTRQEVRLSLKSGLNPLLRNIPINNFWISNFPNLDPSSEGQPIPYYYGVYSAAQAPIVTAINTAYAGSLIQFQICDHAILSIAQVYIDYGAGAGWVTIAHGNEDLANARFTISDAGFVLGTTRVKVAFSGVTDGGIVEGAPEIVEHLLTNFLGYTSDDLNAASFTASKSDSDVQLNVPIETVQSSLSVIEKICASDLAFFDEDLDGKFRYKTWAPGGGAASSIIDETDYEDAPRVTFDQADAWHKINVGYSYCPVTQIHLYQESTNNPTLYKYGKNDPLRHDTYLRESSDATILSQRMAVILGQPAGRLELALKMQHMDLLVGDTLKINMARAPFATAGGYVQRIFEIIETAKYCFPVRNTLVLRDLMEYGSNIGTIMDTGDPDWSTATDLEKAVSGFLTDSDGYAAPGEIDSKNISRLW